MLFSTLCNLEAQKAGLPKERAWRLGKREGKTRVNDGDWELQRTAASCLFAPLPFCSWSLAEHLCGSLPLGPVRAQKLSRKLLIFLKPRWKFSLAAWKPVTEAIIAEGCAKHFKRPEECHLRLCGFRTSSYLKSHLRPGYMGPEVLNPEWNALFWDSPHPSLPPGGPEGRCGLERLRSLTIMTPKLVFNPALKT